MNSDSSADMIQMLAGMMKTNQEMLSTILKMHQDSIAAKAVAAVANETSCVKGGGAFLVREVPTKVSTEVSTEPVGKGFLPDVSETDSRFDDAESEEESEDETTGYAEADSDVPRNTYEQGSPRSESPIAPQQLHLPSVATAVSWLTNCFPVIQDSNSSYFVNGSDKPLTVWHIQMLGVLYWTNEATLELQDGNFVITPKDGKFQGFPIRIGKTKMQDFIGYMPFVKIGIALNVSITFSEEVGEFLIINVVKPDGSLGFLCEFCPGGYAPKEEAQAKRPKIITGKVVSRQETVAGQTVKTQAIQLEDSGRYLPVAFGSNSIDATVKVKVVENTQCSEVFARAFGRSIGIFAGNI